jgi:DNA-binding Lrp family transcriptional regulator
MDPDIVTKSGGGKPCIAGMSILHGLQMILRRFEIILRKQPLRRNNGHDQETRMPSNKLDPIDRQILAELQADGRMTNVELAHRVGISAPPCLRRVRTLEEAGYIKGYHADIDARELGFEVQVFAMVRLQSQAEADLALFESRCKAWPLVRECHMLNGEIDFILKCVAPDLSSFQSFLTGELLKAENVSNVKTSLVIRVAKDDPGLPFDVLEARLKRNA